MPALGQGTWKMGVNPRHRKAEADALRLGLDLGMTLIDTAEMYDEAELVVGDALEGRRDEVFLVTKVLPSNASREGTLEAAERSLKRLRTDRIDLYLLHWESATPLWETLEAFHWLRKQGKILHYGVSNFDTPEMEKAEKDPGGSEIASNQVLYNLARRGVERKLLPWCQEHDVVVMAYSPFDQGLLETGAGLRKVARRHGITPMQTALAWTLRHPGVVAIPKAVTEAHLRANAAAAEVALTGEDLADLDMTYPVPDRDIPLETA
jgi:diketogulonate reductase-like aldo/keto reductase